MARQPAHRLDARIGWRAAVLDHVSARGDRLTLSPMPGTIRPIAAPSGTFGGLSTPLTVAADRDGGLFILDSSGRIRRYNPCLERFEPIACGEADDRPPGLRASVAIALHPGGELLVLDGETRSVTAIALDTRRARRRFGPFLWDGHLIPTRPIEVLDPVTGVATGALALPANGWDPRDVAVLPNGRIAVSDRFSDRIHVFDRRGRVCASFDGAAQGIDPLKDPGPIAVDRGGRIYVVEEGRAAIAILLPEGVIVDRTEDAESLKDRFAAPVVTVDDDGTIWIGERYRGVTEIVRRDCAGQCLPAERLPLTPSECALLAFDTDGRAILGDPRSPCLLRSDATRYPAAGRMISEVLDSGQTRMVWDRMAIDGEAPFGTELIVATATSDVLFDPADVADWPDYRWSETPVRFEYGERWIASIRSQPGRYLWVRLDFASDGAATPVVRSLNASWPRSTSMRFLPACFAADPPSADFLSRFLGLFDQVREEALLPVDRIASYLDPLATQAAEAGAPGDDFLDWLGSWVGLALDRSWSVERRRRLVERAPRLFKIRGTVAGLVAHVEIYTGVKPKVVEHFRLRRWLALDEARIDDSVALWGPEIVKRLQLDAYSEIGRFSLVDGGDPLTDPFDAFAHRATLYVPVCDGFGDADQAALTDVIEMAKPAHVEVDVRLMRPRFVMGCQLLLGVNTVLGRDIRPVKTDESMLGEDIRLAEPPVPFSIRSGLRLGVDTTLE